jgi:enediyne biosynthesis protein E7
LSWSPMKLSLAPTGLGGSQGTLGPIPGPTPTQMMRLIVDLQRDPLTAYTRVRERYGDVVRMSGLNGQAWVFIAAPDSVAHVLQRNHTNYRRGALNRPFTKFLGAGLLTSEKAVWSVHRRIMSPYFRAEFQEDFVTEVWSACGQMLDGWQPAAADGRVVNVCADLERLTLRTVLRGLFGIRLGSDDKPVLRALDNALTYVSRESFRMYPLPSWLNARARWRFDAEIGVLDEVLGRAIADRRAGARRGDLLDALIEANLDERALRDEVVTMVHAGQHTVASGIAFALYLLAQNPVVEECLRAELDPLGGRAPGAADLAALPYLGQVVNETMRLYPPAWGGVRESIAGDELGGYPIPADTAVVFSQYVTHRHPDIWPSPGAFDPDRFAEKKVRDLPRFAYFPFGGGPHLCVGQPQALIELSIVVAMVLQRYRLSLPPGVTVAPRALLDMVPAGGVPMLVAHA